MLISLRHKFIFLAMPKCGSTALEGALVQHSDIKLTGAKLKHTPYSAVQDYLLPFISDRLGSEPQLDAFSLFRDPIDWLFSWYRYRSRPQMVSSGGVHDENYTGNISFADFVAEHFKRQPQKFSAVGRQSRTIVDKNGSFDSVRLYRYEDAGDFLAELEGRIGKTLKVEKKNVSPNKAFDLSVEQIEQAKTMLKQEYKIYDSIPRRSGMIISTTASSHKGTP